MSQYQMLQQDAEDYDKVMGAYSADYNAYADKVNAFNDLPKNQRTKAAAAALPKAPEDPGVTEPTYTRSEARMVASPPQSFADAAKDQPGMVAKMKQATGANWSPYQGGMDSGAGILQKVMKGQA